LERVGGRETIRLDFRLISATNVNTTDAMRAGKFRPDLHYRLNEMTINLPPLRKRNGDIRRITRHYVNFYSKFFGKEICAISGSVMELLDGYDWPGNVRELENVIKSAVVLADNIVLPEHLPREIRGNGIRPNVVEKSCEENNEERLRVEIDLGVSHSEIDLKALGCEAAEQAERLLLEALMRRSGQNGAQMARMLNVDPKTLRMKLRKYGLVPQKL
jgi:DNA-binding NtrC family response regulator